MRSNGERFDFRSISNSSSSSDRLQTAAQRGTSSRGRSFIKTNMILSPTWTPVWGRWVTDVTLRLSHLCEHSVTVWFLHSKWNGWNPPISIPTSAFLKSFNQSNPMTSHATVKWFVQAWNMTLVIRCQEICFSTWNSKYLRDYFIYFSLMKEMSWKVEKYLLSSISLFLKFRCQPVKCSSFHMINRIVPLESNVLYWPPSIGAVTRMLLTHGSAVCGCRHLEDIFEQCKLCQERFPHLDLH